MGRATWAWFARVDATLFPSLTWMLFALQPLWALPTWAGELPELHGDAQLPRYWQVETEKLVSPPPTTLAEWESARLRYLAELREMMGLHPEPSRTPLEAVVTGTSLADGVRVERLYFQSRPGLYVTANFYLPRTGSGPFPAVLYLCGHGAVKIDGISYGNKVHYQHHGVWLARHGFACLVLDSLQLGEIEGTHHGTHHLQQWWWLNRGYTPAGVEAWNCVRALDYLETRPEVDAQRIGVTGRSGGGAYSWSIAALDPRIRAAVPVAGITDLRNHVVDGCVDDHCDCMYFVNTFRWDFAHLAALVAPRPLLIANSDRDAIFPLEGVLRIHRDVRAIYRLYGAEAELGLQITAGLHQDTPELQVAAFRWLNRHVQQQDTPINPVELEVFSPSQLKVFAGTDLPPDEVNTQAAEWFVPAASQGPVPVNAEQWETQRQAWLYQLERLTFAAWPRDELPLHQRQVIAGTWGRWQVRGFHLQSQEACHVPWLLIQDPATTTPRSIDVWVLHDANWQALMQAAPELQDWTPSDLPRRLNIMDRDTPFTQWLASQLPPGAPSAIALVLPRGVGPTAMSGPTDHVQRRYYLLGQTWDSGRIWDVRRTLRGIRQLPELIGSRLRLCGASEAAGWSLFAALYEPHLTEVVLDRPPASYRSGPVLLNISRFLRWDEAVALVAERVPVRLIAADRSLSDYGVEVTRSLGWPAESIMLTAGGVDWRSPPQISATGTAQD